VTCKGNLRSIGLCAIMYSQDYNDHWPAFHSGSSPKNARDADELSLLFDVFLTDEYLLCCPDADNDVKVDTDTSFGHPIVLGTSYCYIGNGSAEREAVSFKVVVSDWWNSGGKGDSRASNHDGGRHILRGSGHVEWVAEGGGIRTELTRPTDDTGACDSDFWGEQALLPILYGPDGTIDDIPENR
jgi:hypothetical protein